MKHNKASSGHRHEGMHKEQMDGKAGRGPKGHLGDSQGNMSPVVDDLQRPNADYSQEFMGKTTQYIERQNRIQGENAKDIENKAYKGRYS
jgi:hypothetical protein